MSSVAQKRGPLLIPVLLCMFAAWQTATAARDEIICLEAETATNVVAPMVVVSAHNAGAAAAAIVKGASGGSYLEIPEGKGSPPKVTDGSAAITFRVKKAGTYILWCRVYWEGECSNSFTMKIDDSPPFSFGQDPTYKSWHWFRAPTRIKQLKLTPGEHTLVLQNREDGVRMDQVLLVNSTRFVPVGVEKVTP